MRRSTIMIALSAFVGSWLLIGAAGAEPVPPGAPVGLTASSNPAHAETATLSWRYAAGSNGGSPLTGYELQVGSSSATRVVVGPDSRRHTFGSLAGGRQYRLYVRAVNVAGASPWVRSRPVTVPLRISDRQGEAGDAMDIEWAAVDNGNPLVITTKHRSVLRSPDAGVGAFIDVAPGNGPEYLVSGSIYDGDYGISLANGWNRGGPPFQCHITMTPNYRRDTVTYRISRPCLNGASFEAQGVRVSAIAGTESSRTDWAPGFRRWSPWVHRTRG